MPLVDGKGGGTRGRVGPVKPATQPQVQWYAYSSASSVSEVGSVAFELAPSPGKTELTSGYEDGGRITAIHTHPITSVIEFELYTVGNPSRVLVLPADPRY